MPAPTTVYICRNNYQHSAPFNKSSQLDLENQLRVDNTVLINLIYLIDQEEYDQRTISKHVGMTKSQQ